MLGYNIELYEAMKEVVEYDGFINDIDELREIIAERFDINVNAVDYMILSQEKEDDEMLYNVIINMLP